MNQEPETRNQEPYVLRSAERANVVVCTGAHVGFGYSVGVVDMLTVLPLLLSRLGAGSVVLGVAWSVASAGWFLTQAPGIFLLGHRPRKKRFLTLWSFVTVVPPFLAVGLVVFLLGATRPALCMALVLVLIAARVLGEGTSYPFWDDWLASLFSKRLRGRAFGLIAAAVAVGAALAALTAGQVCRRLPFPANYALLYCASAGFFAVSLAAIYRAREPGPAPERDAFTVQGLMQRFGQSLREANFRNYLVGRILLSFGGGVVGFYAVHFSSPEGGGLAASTVITVGMCMTIPQAVASYVLGHLGDRAGHKTSIVIGAGAQVLSVLVAYLGRGLGPCILAFVLLGIVSSAGWVSHLNMLFETCPHESRVAHLALSNSVLSPFLVLVPAGTGWLMASVGMRAGMGLALIPAVLGTAWMLLVVREPRTLDLAGRPDDASQ